MHISNGDFATAVVPSTITVHLYLYSLCKVCGIRRALHLSVSFRLGVVEGPTSILTKTRMSTNC